MCVCVWSWQWLEVGLFCLLFWQERLRHWEARERKKLREHDKLELKEKERVEEQQKQAVWLKQFLEDYDDERDDAKYYKYKNIIYK